MQFRLLLGKWPREAGEDFPRFFPDFLDALRKESIRMAARGRHLKRMPARRLHDLADLLDVFAENALVKEVAHRVDEDHARLAPEDRIAELAGHQAKFKYLLSPEAVRFRILVRGPQRAQFGCCGAVV